MSSVVIHYSQCMSPIFPGLDGHGEKPISKSKEKLIKESFQ